MIFRPWLELPTKEFTATVYPKNNTSACTVVNQRGKLHPRKTNMFGEGSIWPFLVSMLNLWGFFQQTTTTTTTTTPFFVATKWHVHSWTVRNQHLGSWTLKFPPQQNNKKHLLKENDISPPNRGKDCYIYILCILYTIFHTIYKYQANSWWGSSKTFILLI